MAPPERVLPARTPSIWRISVGACFRDERHTDLAICAPVYVIAVTLLVVEPGETFMPSENTQTVLDHHLAALLAGDIDGLMEDYTDDSMFISNLGGVLKGLDAIRAMFSTGADMSGWQQLIVHVGDGVAYITWKVEGVVIGTDTFIISDGKIIFQTVYIVFA
jgi:SnoaL-like domain